MTAHCKIQRLMIVVASMVLGAPAGWTRPAVVEDNGGFFSERARAEAAREIEELGRSGKKDLAIETLGELPKISNRASTSVTGRL